MYKKEVDCTLSNFFLLLASSEALVFDKHAVPLFPILATKPIFINKGILGVLI